MGRGPQGVEEAGAEPPAAALVEHLFRRQASRIVASLARSLGPAHLALAEEAVQDALVRALRRWPHHGVPPNPVAWLHRVAKNRALDRLRRAGTFRSKEAEIRHRLLEDRSSGTANPEAPAMTPSDTDRSEPRFRRELTDDQLRLIFLCCHPRLSRDARVALTLKIVCGFGVGEIARAFLDREPTVAQRLVRAKRKIRDLGLPFEVPGPEEIPERLDSVLEVLYLLFNEGYAPRQGDRPVREDMCAEALRLTEELTRAASAAGPVPEDLRPRIHALAALLCFQGSRARARSGSAGVEAGGEGEEADLVLLEDQDRNLWDRRLVRRGFRHLERSAAGAAITPYHLQAAIASHHAAAPTWQATDWPAILELYDRLLELAPSPVVALNRAVALARVESPRAGLAALDALDPEPLAGYHLAHATRGTLLLEAGEPRAAAEAFRRALELDPPAPERRLLERRLARALEAH